MSGVPNGKPADRSAPRAHGPTVTMTRVQKLGIVYILRLLLLTSGAAVFEGAGAAAQAQNANPVPPAVAAATDLPVLRVLLSSMKPPIAGQDIRLLVAVEPGSEPEAGMRLELRGAPDGARLSHGKLAGQGHWIIDRFDIPELDISLPAKAAGAQELHIDLNSKAGRVLASKSVAFVVEPAAGAPTPALTAQPANPPAAAVAAVAPADESKVVEAKAAGSAVAVSKPAPHSPAEPPAAAPPSAQPRDVTVAAVAPSKAAPSSSAPRVAAVAKVEPPKTEPPKAAAPIASETKAADNPPPPPKLAARQPDPVPAQAEPVSPPAAAGTGPSATPAGKQPRELALGKATLATGNIAAARLLLTRAAEAGSAEAALLMGSTYDAAWLQANGARTVVGNREQALRWYTQAQKLGAPEAAAKIAGLPAS